MECVVIRNTIYIEQLLNRIQSCVILEICIVVANNRVHREFLGHHYADKLFPHSVEGVIIDILPPIHQITTMNNGIDFMFL